MQAIQKLNTAVQAAQQMQCDDALVAALCMRATTHEQLEAYPQSLQDYEQVLQLQASHTTVSAHV